MHHMALATTAVFHCVKVLMLCHPTLARGSCFGLSVTTTFAIVQSLGMLRARQMRDVAPWKLSWEADGTRRQIRLEMVVVVLMLWLSGLLVIRVFVGCQGLVPMLAKFWTCWRG